MLGDDISSEKVASKCLANIREVLGFYKDLFIFVFERQREMQRERKG